MKLKKNNIEKIVPSLLAFKLDNWHNDFLIFINNGIKYIHFDVMDYEYVKNEAYNEKDYQYFLKINNNLKSHIHLMVMDPLNEIEKYFYPQTDAICFHFDVYQNEIDKVFLCLKKIKENNIKPGIAINPNFKFNDYEKFLDSCEFVTIMGVYPGKGGQSFEPQCLDNLNAIYEYCVKKNKRLIVEIDGGMNFETIPLIISKSDFIVSGSFLQKNLEKIEDIVHWFKNIN